jgi:hypothetical protein
MRMRVFFAFCLMGPVPVAATPDAPVDFSGEWVSASADPATNGNSADASQHRNPDQSGAGGGGHGIGAGRGMGGGMGAGAGMGGGHGGGYRRSNGSASDRSSGASAAAITDPRVGAHALTIRQSEVVFDVAADGRRTVYRFDNRNNYGAAYGGTVNLSWAAPEMVIETHPDAGGSVEEHYSLSADGKKLTLRVHEQRAGSDSAHDVTRAFVRSGAEGSAAQTLP